MRDAAAGIRKRGFRKWYEGRLIESHAHLVTTFLCLIVVLGAIEQGGPLTSLWTGLWLLGITMVFGGLGAWSWRRYFVILRTAEFLGDRSHCPQCTAYGRFEILRTAPREDIDDTLPAELLAIPTLHVRCRKCAHLWRM